MTSKEKMLVSSLLEMASHEFSNHGCNDLSEELVKMLSKREWIALDKAHHILNGDPEEHDPKIYILL